MLQIILTLAIFVILVIPMGKYMYHIATKQKTFADKVFNPIDRCIYKVCGIKGEDMGWKKYALTLLLVNAVMVFVGYAILRLQSILFLNPNGISNMEPTLSFNTIISFMTNTNLQHYSGESGLSYNDTNFFPKGRGWTLSCNQQDFQKICERCEAKHPPVMFPAIDMVRQPGSRGQIRC